MRQHLAAATLLFACIALPAQTQAQNQGQSQARTATLTDGRTFTLPAAIAGCQNAGETVEGTAIARDFTCMVPEQEGGPATVAGTGAVVLLGEAVGSSDAFLQGQLRQWWPDMSAGDMAQAVQRSAKITANGRVNVACVHRDNVDALNGDAVCLIDQPALRVIIGAQSTMALTADNVVDVILASVTVR